MGYLSSGSKVVFTPDGKRAFLKLLVALSEGQPAVEIPCEGRPEAIILFRTMLLGTRRSSGSSQLLGSIGQVRSSEGGNAVLMMMIFDFLVPKRVFASGISQQELRQNTLPEHRNVYSNRHGLCIL